MTDFASKILDATLEDELGVSFGRYARATILARAIPDVRDGLKPVQRRIIYAMNLAGNTHNNRYRKCAKTVGDVMGSFHPHGDSSIYEAMVRLAQHWKMRATLVDGHGNFGSVDDDPPAAMRYTEARLAPIAAQLVRDIKKNTVQFQPTFDDSDVEPIVLPARYPNLLVNGTSGVSTGFATEIPPHNLGEVIDAVIHLMAKPEAGVEELMGFVQGPDFPTGGIVMGREGIREAYSTGKGRVVVRARTEIETRRDGGKTIAINEIPYGVIKSNLVREMEKLKIAKVVQGIRDVRDESDRTGLRIVVDLKRGVDPEPVRAYMFKKTDLQIYRHFQMVAIVEQTPRQLGLRDILVAYIEHQKDVVTRRSKFDLARALARLHLVEGLIKAVDILDEVIALIRSSKNRGEAHKRLLAELGFTDEQAKEILDLKLHRLTGLQIFQLKTEQKELRAEVGVLEGILGDIKVLMEVIRTELLEVRAEFADPRRSTIVDKVDDISGKIRVTVTVKPQDVVVGVSRSGYIKRSSRPSFEATETGGVKEDDLIRWTIDTNTLHRLVLFSAQGKAFCLPVHEIPEKKWGDVGTALVNVVGIDKGDQVVSVIRVPDFEKTAEVFFSTQLGAVKRTALSEFNASRNSGVAAMRVGADDAIITVAETKGVGDYVLVTHEGNLVRFDADEVPVRGRSAGGVKGLKLNSRDRVVSAFEVDGASDGEVGVITTEGKAKHTSLNDFPRQRRGGRGVRCVRKRARMPHTLVAAFWWPSRLAPVEAIHGVVAESLETHDRKVELMHGASRDGNGYDFFDLGPKQTLGMAWLMGLELPPAEPPADLPPGEDPPPPPEPVDIRPAPAPDFTPVTVEEGGRGGWTQKALFVAEDGSEPEPEPEPEAES
ncbi:MAG: topoisomerase-4 subunit A [Myxococcota bacterium]|jgi:topoisomerase-4 subunit A